MNTIAVLENRQYHGWQARLELNFAWHGEATRLKHRKHVGPLRIQRPLYPEGAAVCHAIVLHPPGGIAGGDTLDMDIEVGRKAHALLTTPGATKWYRSDGYYAQQTMNMHVAAGAVVEWLPQETIVFDGAHAGLMTRIDLEPGANFIGWEVLCLGRSARGETFQHGHLRMQTEVRRAGKPIWLERGHFAGGDRILQAPAGLAGCPVTGTMLVASDSLDNSVLATLRTFETSSRVGVSLMPGLLVARYLGDSAEQARAYFTRVWHGVREPVTRRVPMNPRIWKT